MQVREAEAGVLKAQKELQKVIAERDALATSRGLAAATGDSSLKHENETLRKRLTQREAATREKMSERDAAVNVAEQRRQAVQAQLDQARTENETLMADNTALHRDMMEAKALLPAKTAAIDDLQAKFDLAKHENTALTKRLQAAFAEQVPPSPHPSSSFSPRGAK
jgi:chromosome segregation ATPase